MRLKLKCSYKKLTNSEINPYDEKKLTRWKKQRYIVANILLEIYEKEYIIVN